jgi:gamma-glutamyltranspeptidase / glutathione hydrolase
VGSDREARAFARGCLASPHHLASAAGLDVLAEGGNAVDAAIATNLVLGVVLPYLCGFGGDLFALVWQDGLSGYNGSGRAPAAATVESVTVGAGSDLMPTFGPLAVTVPGAIDGWFTLLERFGTRSFSELAEPALRYARDGFEVSAKAMASIAVARDRFAWSPSWQAVYGSARTGGELRQPDLARTIERLSLDGPEAYYRGPIAEAIVEHVRSLGGLMAPEDLAEHAGDWVDPLSIRYRDVDVWELPPNTQGVTALEAMNIVEVLGGLPQDGPDRQHLMIEAIKLALADRDSYVSDPAAMPVPAQILASTEWAAERARSVDRDRAGTPRPGRPAPGGTAYLCAADRDGMLVSLIQSNYMGFGSGVTVPGWGINLQNRGAFFSLDPAHVNAIAPGKRTLHTLIPAMAFREGRPWLVFGAMGGDGQAQTHLQLLARIADDGEDIQRAIDAPRWLVSPLDWSVTAESRLDPATLDDLRARGHRLAATEDYHSMMGHAHAIVVADDGYRVATDPRAEGAALGL